MSNCQTIKAMSGESGGIRRWEVLVGIPDDLYAYEGLSVQALNEEQAAADVLRRLQERGQEPGCRLNGKAAPPFF